MAEGGAVGSAPGAVRVRPWGGCAGQQCRAWHGFWVAGWPRASRRTHQRKCPAPSLGDTEGGGLGGRPVASGNFCSSRAIYVTAGTQMLSAGSERCAAYALKRQIAAARQQKPTLKPSAACVCCSTLPCRASCTPRAPQVSGPAYACLQAHRSSSQHPVTSQICTTLCLLQHSPGLFLPCLQTLEANPAAPCLSANPLQRGVHRLWARSHHRGAHPHRLVRPAPLRRRVSGQLCGEGLRHLLAVPVVLQPLLAGWTAKIVQCSLHAVPRSLGSSPSSWHVQL